VQPKVAPYDKKIINNKNKILNNDVKQKNKGSCNKKERRIFFSNFSISPFCVNYLPITFGTLSVMATLQVLMMVVNNVNTCDSLACGIPIL
tara:strand:- start:167 stop:439 length:273 start_codon:yes stop_codon:yes gene_type:complete